jgi:hypothetical protein
VGLRTFLLFAVVTVLAGRAFAGEQCYSPTELQAEQLLRLHSELMVIVVTCHQGSRGENLVPAYTGFTQENLRALHDAEQTMMHYYKTVHGGNGVAQLDKLRTKLGNEYGQKIADISAPVFCSRYRDKVLTFKSCGPAQLQDEVQRMVKTEKSYVHTCVGPSTRIAKRAQ